MSVGIAFMAADCFLRLIRSIVNVIVMPKKVGEKIYPNGKTLPLYEMNCSIHGTVTTTPSGWSNKLVCPKCLEMQDNAKGIDN